MMLTVLLPANTSTSIQVRVVTVTAKAINPSSEPFMTRGCGIAEPYSTATTSTATTLLGTYKKDNYV